MSIKDMNYGERKMMEGLSQSAMGIQCTARMIRELVTSRAIVGEEDRWNDHTVDGMLASIELLGEKIGHTIDKHSDLDDDQLEDA